MASRKHKNLSKHIKLPTLPEELIVIICRLIADKATLRNFCLTSRYYRNLVQPILFEDITVHGSALISLTRSLRGRPQRVRSITVESYFADKDEVLTLCDEAGDESLHKLSRIKERMDTYSAHFDAISEPWSILLEQMLFLVPQLEALTISVSTAAIYPILSDDCFELPPASFLPRLQKLTYIDQTKRGSLVVIQGLLQTCPIRQLTAVGLGSRFEHAYPRLINIPCLDSIRSLRLRSAHPDQWLKLPSACPNLINFQYYLTPEEYDDEETGQNPSATDIVTALEPRANILESLSLSTESGGSDDGFPSITHFRSLKHLRLDSHELADWHYDNTITPRPCIPIWHLLPNSLESLWLDNIHGQMGEFDANMLKLAEIAKDDFPNLRKVTIEGAEMVRSRKSIQNGFEKAGIELVKKPICHNWYVEEGLDGLIEDFLDPDEFSDELDEEDLSLDDFSDSLDEGDFRLNNDFFDGPDWGTGDWDGNSYWDVDDYEF